MKISITVWTIIASFALAGASARAAVITITNEVAANAGVGSQGQSFTPSTNDGYAGSPATVNLTQFTVGALFGDFQSSYPDAQTNPIYLHIYSGFLYGSGNGQFGTPSGLLGISNNSHVWSTVSGLNTLTYTFDPIALTYSIPTTYYALFSTSATTSGAGLTNRATFNSGGSESYTGGGGIVNQGPTETTLDASNDMRFTATFDTVPEPSIFALFIVSGLALIMFRRNAGGRSKTT